ncbi:MAG: DUF4102 domain-containing protein, partial [Myxococcales bacterium]|nr:DUF4102 domain-containing protein [Myxococcales bacterium]
MAEALTNATLRRLKPRARTYEVTCGKLSGFAVRVLPSGKKVFVVRVRRGSRDARVRLGQWETDLSLQEAT